MDDCRASKLAGASGSVVIDRDAWMIRRSKP
jgi:hypothetical protein